MPDAGVTAGAGAPAYGPDVAAPADATGGDVDGTSARAADEAAAREAAQRAARARAALLRTMRREPTSFDFVQAVRLLTRMRAGRAPVGGWADPADEVARFTVHPSLGFPPSEIQTLDLPPSVDDADARDDGPPARFAVNFFGLTGPQGVLPHVYTEHAAARARARDTAFRDFLDLFHHRALSLYYRVWEQGHYATAHESGREDRLYEHLLDLAGVGTPGLRERLPARDEALAFYAGLLAQRGRPADGLSRLVGDYFDVPVEVEQFVGEWRHVDAGGQCTLGEPRDAGRLGFGVLGDAAWDAQARVRLRLGPLTRAQFDAFLPGGHAHASLVALARLYADDQVGVDAQLVLLRDAVDGCTLGAPVSRRTAAGAGDAAPRAGMPRLGRGSWLASRPMPRDPDDTVLALC